MKCLTFIFRTILAIGILMPLGSFGQGNNASVHKVYSGDSLKNNKSILSNQVVDIDGNVYGIVKIGNQRWMKQNLKTTRFRDGSAIKEIENSITWSNHYSSYLQTSLADPAWCYYNGNASYNAIYGKLYNWHAAVDSRGLCPSGWHTPSDSDWQVLSSYIYPSAPRSADHMKALKLWKPEDYPDPELRPDNSSGFSALPAGERNVNGYFYAIGETAIFWSSNGSGVYSGEKKSQPTKTTQSKYITTGSGETKKFGEKQ